MKTLPGNNPTPMTEPRRPLPLITAHWTAPALLSAAIRVALIAAACAATGLSLGQYALLHDGWEYLRLARAIGAFDAAGLEPAQLRFFPGYPLAIAAFAAGRWFVPAALFISIACAAACAPLAAALGRDRRIAWWMVAVTPSWLIYSAVAMSESFALLATLLALLALQRRRWLPAGLAIGVAILIRPVGALLLVPLAVETWRVGDRRGAARAFAAALPLPILYLLLNHLVWGDALESVRRYGRQDFAFPLSSFAGAFRDPDMSLIWVFYNYVILAISLAGGWGLWRRLGRGEGWARPLLAWHAAALLFYLLLPSSWAFQSFDRFAIAFWPTTLVGILPRFPRWRVLNIMLCFVVTIVSFFIAWRWLVNLAAVFPFTERI